MTGLQEFLNHPHALKWGWVLLHFLWQGAILSLLAWVVLSLCAGKSARLRYLLATGCLFLMPVCPLVTWFTMDLPAGMSASVDRPEAVSPAPSNIARSVSPMPSDETPAKLEFSGDDAVAEVLGTDVFESSEPAVSSPPSASSPVRASRLEDWLPWLVAIWSLGVFILSIRLAGGWMFARGCVSQGHPLRETWAERVRQLTDRLDLARAIRWVESSRIRVPQAFGWLKPVVLVPGSLFTTLSPDEIECLLLHELMHIRRHDFVVNLVQCVIETILFYHPGVRWLSRRVRLERELACDEAVVNLTDDKLTFSRALLSLADHAQLPQPTLAATEGDLTTRIRTLLGLKRKSSAGGLAVWVCLAACTLALGVLFVPASQVSSQRDHTAETAEEEQDSTATNETDEDGQDGTPRTHLFGKVVDEEGHPVAGADVHTSMDGKKYSTDSGSDGEFSMDVPRPGPLRNVKSLLVFADTDKGRLQGTAYIKLVSEEDKPAEATEIILQPARKFGVVVRDVAGEPVPGVTVRLTSTKSGKLDEETTDAEGRALLVVPADVPLRSIVAFKKGVGIDYESFGSVYGSTNVSLYSKDAQNPVQLSLQPCRPVTVHVVDEQQRPVSGARVTFPDVRGIPGSSGISDDDGNVTFEMVPWNVSGAQRIGVYKEGYIDMKSTYFHPEAETWKVTAELVPKIIVKGRVTMPDGRPVAEAEVRARGESYAGPNSELVDLGRTNDDGRFEFQLRPMMFYSFMAWKGDFISPSKEVIIYEEAPAETLRLQLVAATRVRGRVTVGEEREPAGDKEIRFGLQPQQAYSDLAGNRKLPDPYHNSSLWSLNPVHGWFKTMTNPQGRFEVMLGPGTYRLGDPTDPYNKPYEFTVQDESALDLEVHFSRRNTRRTAPKSSSKPPDDAVPLAGRVVSKADPDRGIPNVRIRIFPRNEYSTPLLQTDADGMFVCQRGPEGTSYLYAETPDGQQGALKAVEPEDLTVNLAVEPWVSVTGRLVDARIGQPLAGESIRCAAEYKTGVEFHPFSELHARRTKTDSAGKFTIGGLLPGWEYVIRADRVRAQGYRDESVWVRVGQVSPKAGDEPIDAGDLKFETHRPVTLKP